MKILLISRYHPSNLAKGGPELITKNLYDALKRKGYEIDLLSPRQLGLRNKLLISVKLAGAIWANRKKYDVINIDTGTDILPFFIFPFKKVISCPVVLTVHGFPKLERQLPMNDLHERLLRPMISAYKNNICVSNLLKNAVVSELKTSKRNSHNFYVIHNGINRLFLKRPFLATINPSKGLILLLVGGIDERKGIWFLVNCLKRIGNMDWRLTIIGKSDVSSGKFWKAVDENGWQNRIRYIQWIDQSKLIQYYDNCDIVVAPSRFDTFNVPVLEGMARGKPVITTYTSGASEVIENYKDGIIVDFNDVEALVNAISYLRNVGKRDEIGRNARIKAERYSWNNVVERYIKAYKAFIMSEANPK